MKIAQVAPLYESVPPKLYGGTERVVAHLTDELVRQGHDVTLFASGDSVTAARLVAACPVSLRLNPQCTDRLAYHYIQMEQVAAEASRFDVIHFHTDYLHFAVSRRESVCHATTLHGRLDLPDLVPLYETYREMPVISISASQREPLPWLNWQGTVHHGFPSDYYDLHTKHAGYLAFLGRVSPEKGLDEAIHIARRTGIPLKIGAKVDHADRAYYESKIKPLLESADIEFLGEIGYPDTEDLLGGAMALLFPIQWPEPFGLVMIEAMACGTPVIAYNRGSVPEVLEHGVSGMIVNNLEEAVEAVRDIECLSRKGCRRAFEDRFTVQRMVKDYLKIYTRLGRLSWQRSISDGVPVG
jgi:glycosyltransferase involved in cell wall biosynthesis